jgi:molybdopterin/thiamine biosynthesis adenylyltransferase
MKTKKTTVKLSDATCLFCTKSGVILETADFRGAVCAEHQIALMKKWKKDEESKVETKEEKKS